MSNDPVWAPQRLAAVLRTGLLDTAPEESFDRLAALARDLLRTPYAFITLVDDQRSFWKSRLGVDEAPGAAAQNTVEESFCQYVVRSGRPLVSGDVRLDPLTAGNPSIDAMGVVAWAGYPVHSPDGQVLGSFCVLDTVPRDWTDADRRVLQTLSKVAATEVALRLVAHDAATAAAAASAAQHRAQLLADSGELLRAGLELGDVLAAVARLVVPALGGAATVSTLGERGAIEPRASCVECDDPAHEARLREIIVLSAPAVDDESGTGYVLRTGQAHQGTVDAPGTSPIAVLCVPLRAHGRIVGVLRILGAAGVEYSGADLTLAQEVADRAALALDNAELYAEQRDAAMELQQALLSPPPVLEGLEIAVRYLPAAAHTQVGGDWYDVFVQPDGSTALVIGDVVGHDLHAAAGMGQLRSMLRVLGYTDAKTPAAVLDQLDAAMTGLGVDTMATAVLARIETSSPTLSGSGTTLRWSNAGHLPPVLLRPDGTVSVLETAPEVLLGLMVPSLPRTDHCVDVDAGSTLVLYTDGLVERRGRLLTDGITRLAAVVAALHDAPLEELCDKALAALLPEAPEDDVAVLAVRVGGAGVS